MAPAPIAPPPKAESRATRAQTDAAAAQAGVIAGLRFTIVGVSPAASPARGAAGGAASPARGGATAAPAPARGAATAAASPEKYAFKPATRVALATLAASPGKRGATAPRGAEGCAAAVTAAEAPRPAGLRAESLPLQLSSLLAEERVKAAHGVALLAAAGLTAAQRALCLPQLAAMLRRAKPEVFAALAAHADAAACIASPDDGRCRGAALEGAGRQQRRVAQVRRPAGVLRGLSHT